MSVFCIRFLSVFFFILFLIYKQTLKINFNLKCAKIILLMKMNLISLVLCQIQYVIHLVHLIVWAYGIDRFVDINLDDTYNFYGRTIIFKILLKYSLKIFYQIMGYHHMFQI